MLFHAKINLTSRLNPTLGGEEEGGRGRRVETLCVLGFHLYGYGKQLVPDERFGMHLSRAGGQNAGQHQFGSCCFSALVFLTHL